MNSKCLLSALVTKHKVTQRVQYSILSDNLVLFEQTHRFTFVQLSIQDVQSLHDYYPWNYRICCGDGWNNITCHGYKNKKRKKNPKS